MDTQKKLEIITNHLLLEKKKAELELERFINSDASVDDICKNIEDKLNNYRNTIANVSIWLEFLEPSNKPEEGNK
jgi:hypothetical protein